MVGHSWSSAHLFEVAGSHFSDFSSMFDFFVALKDNLQIVAGNSSGGGKEGDGDISGRLI